VLNLQRTGLHKSLLAGKGKPLPSRTTFSKGTVNADSLLNPLEMSVFRRGQKLESCNQKASLGEQEV